MRSFLPGIDFYESDCLPEDVGSMSRHRYKICLAGDITDMRARGFVTGHVETPGYCACFYCYLCGILMKSGGGDDSDGAKTSNASGRKANGRGTCYGGAIDIAKAVDPRRVIPTKSHEDWLAAMASEVTHVGRLKFMKLDRGWTMHQ